MNCQIYATAELAAENYKLAKLAEGGVNIDRAIKSVFPFLTACRPFPMAVVVSSNLIRGMGEDIKDFTTGRLITESEDSSYLVIVEGPNRYQSFLNRKKENPDDESDFYFAFVEEVNGAAERMAYRIKKDGKN